MEHSVYSKTRPGKTVLSPVRDGNDRTRVSAMQLQTFHELRGVCSAAAQIDQSEAEAPARERVLCFAWGRSGHALISSSLEKAEQTQLRCSVDFKH